MSTKPRSTSSQSTRAEPNDAALVSKPTKLPAGLYLVATPIGNLADITLRALDVLSAAGTLACEDTRITRKLLNAYGLDRSLSTYHEHNAERMRPRLIERLKNGESVALVCDAGTPLVSDPGYKLVRAAIAEGLVVSALPGPSAPLAALVVSGQPSDRFLYAGFLPVRQAARRKALVALARVPATLIFFESARRLAASLEDMAEVLGTRSAAVVRELTKLFEDVRRGDLAHLAGQYRAAGPPKGEVVIVVGPPQSEVLPAADLDARLAAALKQASLRDAAARVAAETGVPRRQVYARALALSGRERGKA
jgi:16S rRNA (cytidine1402-2'-O)-methyltransferase